jgi:hypothetical protein
VNHDLDYDYEYDYYALQLLSEMVDIYHPHVPVDRFA